MTFKSNCSVFLQNCSRYPDTRTLNSIPNIVYANHASLKRSIHVQRSQIVIEANLILHAFGQPSPDRSTDGSPWLCGTNKTTLRLWRGPYMRFSLAFPRRIQRNHQIQRQTGNVQNVNSGSKVTATISLRETACCVINLRSTQAGILTTSVTSVSIGFVAYML